MCVLRLLASYHASVQTGERVKITPHPTKHTHAAGCNSQLQQPGALFATRALLVIPTTPTRSLMDVNNVQVNRDSGFCETAGGTLQLVDLEEHEWWVV